MGNTFFTSDTHWFHNLVSGLRGFQSVEDHNATLIKNWHGTVGADDTVWVLGDLTCTRKEELVDKALGIMSRLPGTKHFVAGNHDNIHPMHKQSWKQLPKFLSVFQSVQPFAKLSIQKIPVLLSHFPYEFDHTERERYAQWRLPDLGEYLIHGHLHSKEKITSSRELHIGLDAWDLKPVPMQMVERFVTTGTL